VTDAMPEPRFHQLLDAQRTLVAIAERLGRMLTLPEPE
jgi:hypothetical protein